ncbi:TIM barrel protein [Horticoccus luteus]|uniref:TIM barrel protein n=1 Tax=Horticoccus luteus TaxID=2862869 RepID=A0A8F9XK40_9BACT|nr:TIM barrel protein [Horticoccus luteus]QYM79313.1 TIM barrel protein [Horticoccus luteus]
MLSPGLVSITFRKLSPREIVALVRRAGLRAIEWGGDIHVPHGELGRARETRELTADAGLTVAAYGSYYRVGHSEDDGLAFEAVLETALELGAPLIRVWAGTVGSANIAAGERDHLFAELRRIAALAARARVQIAPEFHGGTFNDTNASCRELLAAVPDANVLSYWQPLLGMDEASARAGLTTIGPRLAHLHVYHWITVQDRRPLAEGAALWRERLALVNALPGEHAALLEFVRDDSPEQFLHDAATLLDCLRVLPV